MERAILGATEIEVSLLGFGTGSAGWNNQSNQTRLGQTAFTALVRHAVELGVTYLDCAGMYGSHPFVREAIKGLDRDKLVIQTKSEHRDPQQIRDNLDRFRLELGVDVLDVFLMHVVNEPDWNVRYRPVMDVLEEARQLGIIKAHGCTCHTIEALEAASNEPWVQICQARLNPWGKSMENRRGEPESSAPGNVVPILRRMRDAGKGVTGMKIMAEGKMVRGGDRLARIRETVEFALTCGALDAMVIGFEKPEQIDEVATAMQEISPSN